VFYPENGVLHCNYSPLWNALHFVVKVQLGSANYRQSAWNNCTSKIGDFGGIEPHSIAAPIPHRRQASLWREYLGELRWAILSSTHPCDSTE
jgi:hypothetical protein